MTRLFTCSYSEYRSSMGLGVRASIGTPRWIKRDDPWPAVPELFPGRAYFQAPLEVFNARYLDQLDRFGADRLQSAFAMLAGQYEADRLVLLCFEVLDRSAEGCHRTLFADWWTRQTGQEVVELGKQRLADLFEQEPEP